MKDVKTKPSMRSAKVLDRTVRIPRDTKAAMSKLRRQTDQAEQYESPADYADQQIKENATDAANHTADGVRSGVRRAVDQAKRQKAPSGSESGAYQQNATYQGGRRYAEGQARAAAEQRQGAANAQQTAHVRSTGRYTEPPKTAPKGSASTVKQKAARAAKTTSKSVKTASHSVKNVQRTAKTAQKTAQATAKAAQAARKAAQATARATAKAAKVAAKAVVAAVKAIAAAIKALVAAIAAGGWVAVVVILVIAAVAAILLSAFGVFFSNESADGAPMTEIIRAIDTEYRSGIGGKIAELSVGEYDEIKVVYRGDGDGDSAAVNNWNDVLSVYAVLTTTKEDNPTDVVVVSPENEQVLREVFAVMNTVSYDSAVTAAETSTTDDDGNVVVEFTQTLTVYVTISAMSYKEGAEHYGFSDYQTEIAEEMMSPAYFSYFAALIGVDVYGGANLTDIVSGLPANAKGSEVVKAALTKLGASYVMGAKGENKFDCSGLVYWSIKQVDPSLGDRMYTNAAGQAKYCYDRGLTVGESELMPGDLVFWQNLSCEGCHRWQEVHHTGVYIGGGKVVEASSGKGRVVIRDLWSTTNYPIYLFGRPY